MYKGITLLIVSCIALMGYGQEEKDSILLKEYLTHTSLAEGKGYVVTAINPYNQKSYLFVSRAEDSSIVLSYYQENKKGKVEGVYSQTFQFEGDSAFQRSSIKSFDGKFRKAQPTSSPVYYNLWTKKTILEGTNTYATKKDTIQEVWSMQWTATTAMIIDDEKVECLAFRVITKQKQWNKKGSAATAPTVIANEATFVYAKGIGWIATDQTTTQFSPFERKHSECSLISITPQTKWKESWGWGKAITKAIK